MAEISEELAIECKRLVEEEWKYNEIGNDQHEEISPCKVAKLKSKYVSVFNETYTIGQITFMAYKKRKCRNNKEISHQCGKDKCFVFAHIEEKITALNIKRRSCHSEIKDYFNKIYKNLSYSEKNKTPGPLFVHDIPESAYSKLRPGPKTDKKYTKSREQKDKEKAHRNRYKKKYGKKYIKPTPKRVPFKCLCRPLCFMNFNTGPRVIRRRSKRVNNNTQNKYRNKNKQ